MGFREIRTRERITEKDEREYGYLKIKPKTEKPAEELVKECMAFWEQEIMAHRSGVEA